MSPHCVAETLLFLNSQDHSLQTVQQTTSLPVGSLAILTSSFIEISFCLLVEAFLPQELGSQSC